MVKIESSNGDVTLAVEGNKTEILADLTVACVELIKKLEKVSEDETIGVMFVLGIMHSLQLEEED